MGFLGRQTSRTSCFQLCVSKENWPELKKNPTDADGKVIEAERKWSMPLSGPCVMAPSRQVEMFRCETSSSKLRTCLSGKIVELKRGTVIFDVFQLRLSQVNCRFVENAGIPQTVRQ